MTSSAFQHQPVMLDQVLKFMAVKPSGVYVDGTFGRGGHSKAILDQLDENGRLLVMDKDPEAIACANDRHGSDRRVTVIHDDYAHMAEHVERLGLSEQVDGVLLDLGVSSPQLDDAARGFSFQQNGPLDMRMDTSRGQTAAEWLQQATEQQLADVLWQLGEERFSRRIARRIVEYREQQTISDTDTLVEIIKSCVPAGKEKKHPATRSFQAIRMKVNQELEHVQKVLGSIFDVLRIGGRVLVISFHSLEDRLVKRFFRQYSKEKSLPRGLPLTDSQLPVTIRLKELAKAVKATEKEITFNPRARSAVLRIAERVV